MSFTAPLRRARTANNGTIRAPTAPNPHAAHRSAMAGQMGCAVTDLFEVPYESGRCTPGGAGHGPTDCPPSYPEREKRYHCEVCDQWVLGEPHICEGWHASGHKPKGMHILASMLDVLAEREAKARAEGYAQAMKNMGK